MGDKRLRAALLLREERAREQPADMSPIKCWEEDPCRLKDARHSSRRHSGDELHSLKYLTFHNNNEEEDTTEMRVHPARLPLGRQESFLKGINDVSPLVQSIPGHLPATYPKEGKEAVTAKAMYKSSTVSFSNTVEMATYDPLLPSTIAMATQQISMKDSNRIHLLFERLWHAFTDYYKI